MKQPTISLVVAAALNNGIGLGNQLLWHLPADLKHFKNITWAGVVIMGRKTFESVGKPLPGRLNIVITSNAQWEHATVLTAKNLDEAIALATAQHFKEIFIIGGGQVYNEALAKAEFVYLTRVQATLQADTFFPELNNTQWQCISKEAFKADEKNAFDLSFEKWERV